eukprot:CAMPEP_0182880244 /NCGR_PEP_ID=MMETSP0034_2-20130328/16455_1 /TAXON_ID=156128 /ORGANISM="Nephroselmis pyriformis, Strain CCMP717" /LENGTH=371 /DNA_ID=CAMNT_0025013225 /DNA_START=63 /DNA_END=1175 /DNA_ORIENTATION=+
MMPHLLPPPACPMPVHHQRSTKGAICMLRRSAPCWPGRLLPARHPRHAVGVARSGSGPDGLGPSWEKDDNDIGLDEMVADGVLPPLESESLGALVPPPAPEAPRGEGKGGAGILGIPLHQEGDVIGGKYTVIEALGSGASGTTYKCGAPGGEVVAVKAVSLRSNRDWKVLELFEREASILKQLSHPSIPAYSEYLEVDTERDRAFYLVQELVEGVSLAEMVAGGQARLTEGEITRIALELVGVLEYLGDLRPPVVHRDIKPENILIEGGKPGGRVFLVDFGGVQEAAKGGGNLGSTVVGTYGYMAPEQFRGAAGPASDVYSLGATLLYLASRRAPSEFPLSTTKTLGIEFGDVEMGGVLRDAVEGMLEPNA